MHPTIEQMQKVVAKGDHTAIAPLLARDVKFMPPTYWKTWTGRDAVAAVTVGVKACHWGGAKVGQLVSRLGA